MANKVGRPSKYNPEYCDMVFGFVVKGYSPDEIASEFNTTKDELETWFDQYPEFRNKLLYAAKYIEKREIRLKKKRQYNQLPETKQKNSDYIKRKLKTDGQYRVRFNFSSLLRSRLKTKSEGVFRNLDYSAKDLRDHLESLFIDGMTWDNYGKVWHVDHKTPDSWFKYDSVDDEGFKKSWALSNLQPLFKEDNLRKGNRYAG